MTEKKVDGIIAWLKGWFYDKSEVDTALVSKADSNHTHSAYVNPTIVNDLTTGGTTSVLSAEQGKTLNTNKVDKETNKALFPSSAYDITSSTPFRLQLSNNQYQNLRDYLLTANLTNSWSTTEIGNSSVKGYIDYNPTIRIAYFYLYYEGTASANYYGDWRTSYGLNIPNTLLPLRNTVISGHKYGTTLLAKTDGKFDFYTQTTWSTSTGVTFTGSWRY